MWKEDGRKDFVSGALDFSTVLRKILARLREKAKVAC